MCRIWRFWSDCQTGREANPDAKGNIWGEANASQLECLANLLDFYALVIKEGIEQDEWLKDGRVVFVQTKGQKDSV